MNKTWIVFRNELRSTLKRKGFIITTLVVPLIGLLAILIFQLVNHLIQPPLEAQKVGYIDQAAVVSQNTQQDKVQLLAFLDQQQATSALISGQIKEYFVIPPDYLSTGVVVLFTLRTEVEPPRDIVKAAQNFLIENLAAGKLGPEVLARIKSPLQISSVVLDKTTGRAAPGQGGLGSLLIAYLFGILLLMSIFTASGYLLQGLSEEKESRVMEVLLSSISTRQLITGKVLGLGAAGLLQMLFWLLSAWGLLSLASLSIGGFFSSLQFPPSVLVFSLIYFILGYFLYAIVMAGVGAIVPTVRDGQQLSVIVTILGAVPFMLMAYIIENGDSALNKALTLIPPTAPMTVMMRINAGIPPWEFGVSILLLLGSILGSLFLASRLFRTYLLMYGKTPGWKQIMRSLREA